MKKVIAASLISVLMLVNPRPADAGIRSGLKKAAIKVGHVAENALYVAVATVVVIGVCKSGGCN